jgi:hypothetical protein
MCKVRREQLADGQCLRAVQQCAVRGSFAEAVAQFEVGLEQLQKLPDDDQRAELELEPAASARGLLRSGSKLHRLGIQPGPPGLP